MVDARRMGKTLKLGSWMELRMRCFRHLSLVFLVMDVRNEVLTRESIVCPAVLPRCQTPIATDGLGRSGSLLLLLLLLLFLLLWRWLLRNGHGQ